MMEYSGVPVVVDSVAEAWELVAVQRQLHLVFLYHHSR
jgi:hypothetical protein